jgi:hypothetical protein
MYLAMAFAKLMRQLDPTPLSIEKGKLHASTIKQRLASTMDVASAHYIGSTTRYTAIRGASDVDYLAVIPRHQVLWGERWISSDTLVNTVRTELMGRFRQTEIRRDAQAVVVHFGGGSEPVDVVPAVFHSFKLKEKVPVYLIPDGAGGWLETAPAAHSNYIKAANEKSGGKLRRVIQLLKHWRNARSPAIPLSSIHLETLLAASDICIGPKSYSLSLVEVFALFHRRACRGFQDPIGLAGVFPAACTEAKLARLIESIQHALDHSMRAYEAECRKDWREALRQWGIVFNGQFSL